MELLVLAIIIAIVGVVAQVAGFDSRDLEGFDPSRDLGARDGRDAPAG